MGINDWGDDFRARFEEARRKIGIKSPVTIKSVAFKPPVGGAVDVRNGEVVVILNANQPLKEVSRSAYEELAHVWQMERAGGWDEFNRIYDEQLEAAGLSPRGDLTQDPERVHQIPLEREADALAARWAKEHPLVDLDSGCRLFHPRRWRR
jgi:hypothetical protein